MNEIIKRARQAMTEVGELDYSDSEIAHLISVTGELIGLLTILQSFDIQQWHEDMVNLAGAAGVGLDYIRNKDDV